MYLADTVVAVAAIFAIFVAIEKQTKWMNEFQFSDQRPHVVGVVVFVFLIFRPEEKTNKHEIIDFLFVAGFGFSSFRCDAETDEFSSSRALVKMTKQHESTQMNLSNEMEIACVACITIHSHRHTEIYFRFFFLRFFVSLSFLFFSILVQINFRSRFLFFSWKM